MKKRKVEQEMGKVFYVRNVVQLVDRKARQHSHQATRTHHEIVGTAVASTRRNDRCALQNSLRALGGPKTPSLTEILPGREEQEQSSAVAGHSSRSSTRYLPVCY